MLVLDIPGPATKEKTKRVENVLPASPGFKDLLTRVLETLLTIAKRFPGIH